MLKGNGWGQPQLGSLVFVGADRHRPPCPALSLGAAVILGACYLDGHRFEVVEEVVVGFPAVDLWRGGSEPDGLGVGVGVELFADAGAADDDAGLAVAGGEYAQAPGFEVERGGVPASGQW